jgi:hypothetical protein
MIDQDGLPMRPVILVLGLLVLAACTEATASRVDERTFRIEGPSMGTVSDAPNRRVANRICPKGYRVVDADTHRGGPDRAIDESNPMTVWTIRCI